MNCFVIMPFASEFDDVYASIKSSVEEATSAHAGRCFRLDEERPAGRITNRLLQELASADVCVADLTGCSPNVMWEVGYVMALNIPTIIITQTRQELPFDLRDMQTVRYDRGHLKSTLGEPLKKNVIDTCQAFQHKFQKLKETGERVSQESELIGELLIQIADLKSMVAEAVMAWGQPHVPSRGSSLSDELRAFEGYWYDRVTKSHFYARVVNNDLIVPYSYGPRTHLTAVLYGWQKMNGYWFVRFAWLKSVIRGFMFLRNSSVGALTGAWWYDNEIQEVPRYPVGGSGKPLDLIQKPDSRFPKWAQQFLERTSREGLPPQVLRDPLRVHR